MPDQAPSIKKIALGASFFLLVNLVIFVSYRSIFLSQFVDRTSFADTLSIHLSGLRLDLALLAIESVVILTFFFFTRYLRLRPAVVILTILTALHLFVAAANLIFFSERNQHLWEMLFANLSQPNEILNACEPYFKEAPLMTALVIFCAIGLIYLGIRKTRPLSGRRLDLWSSRRRITLTAIAWFLLFSVQFDRVDFAIRKGWRLGWIPLPTASHYYMKFNSYVANQSVINPVHDFVRFYLPAQFTGKGNAHEARLEPEVALSMCQQLLGIESSLSDQFPLQKRSRPVEGAGFTNVVLIQVEGLTQSMVYMTEGPRQVMPFLHRLTSDGLFVPNLFQNYNATDGGALSTITGTYKVFFNKDWKYFLPGEVNGYFASLPRILGKEEFRHLAFFGFRNRREDFGTFLTNQGYSPMDYRDFKALSIPDSLNPLGLFDHVLFEVAADVLRESSRPFSAYLMTTTTHSPWAIPEDQPHPFESARYNAFHYLDRCLENFIASLRRSHPGFADTLFVVTADHTSVTSGPGLMERLQIPLFFYADRLAAVKDKLPIPNEIFSQVDIVPTILDLMKGEHTYSGLGRSILTAQASGPGAISSNRYESLYLKHNFAYVYSPFAPAAAREKLYQIRDGEIIEADVSSEHPEVLATLSREFFALYETSERLVKERRMFPAGN